MSVMAVIPIGISRSDFPESNATPGNQESVDSADKFKSALLQTQISAPLRSPSEVSDKRTSNDFFIDPHTLSAADDAWVGFLAISEQLQNPNLSLEKKDSLLTALADNWRSFKSQSEPIERLVEYYMERNPSTMSTPREE